MLARREHTREELRKKLLRFLNDELLLDRVLDGLAQERLQSDARHAESYVRERAGKGYGPVRIVQELRDRGTSKEVINAAINAFGGDWLQRARGTRVKRFGQSLPQTPAERARQMRFLEYRGYTSETVRRAAGVSGDD